MCLRCPILSAFYLIFLLLTGVRLKSQEIQVRYLGIENGLSNNAVNAIFQDHNNFMWFGTYDGLNCYDGYSFKVFRNVIGDSTSINSNNVNALDEDAKHNIWIGGQKEVSIYNPVTAKFSTPNYILSNGVKKQNLKDNVVDGGSIIHGNIGAAITMVIFQSLIKIVVKHWM